ncbi:unnamed protein product [Rotaria socialis]|uniref:F-box domain-containing protein n=1 Tax=Rotaria socialis TaxID=392032 RepID=A0A818AV95_9BILA|nr:unnamed protein product [Rotaria socialis]CAF3515752.1 unnamed protein product [Rotaria socialis]CAF4206103.1 unnamed protein product [Rotaria socialis]CAF4447323.1 unnamed protein product [Rotaria socialis]
MSSSKLENLANEILLEIFDYLLPIDLIRACDMLNERIQNLITQRRMHVDLSTNLSFNDFNEYCSKICFHYSSCIYSVRLSNVETCGGIKLFFTKFSQIERTFPNLRTMSFTEPNEMDYKQIVKLKHLTSIHLKCYKMSEQKIHLGLLFDIPYLETCVLGYDDALPVQKLRPNLHLNRLILDSFYINDLHTLFHFYPSLQHLSINRLVVNFHGFLPPLNRSFETLRTLKLNCVYTVRSDYVAHILSILPRLTRFTIVAIGIDFLSSKQWLEILATLEKLRFLTLDIKAVSVTSNNEISPSFLTEFWRQWHIAVDYSQDNKKFHLFTVPYRRLSFISTIHCLPVIEVPHNAFSSVTDIYLKTNIPMQIQSQRVYPNVRALQIYQNAIVPVNYSTLLLQLQSMFHLNKLVHLELFIPLPTSSFLALLKSTPCLRNFKTDYDILTTVTDRLQNKDVCSQLYDKLEKFVLRRGILPIVDHNRFLEIFSNLKHLQINLNTIYDLRQIAGKFIKNMTNLLTLNIWLTGTNEPNDTLQWEGIVNNVSYEIAKRHIKIWK